MSKRMRSNQVKGFTLIELLVVIAIIGILAALLFPGISRALIGARANAMASEGSEISSAMFAAITEGDFRYPRQTDDFASSSTDFFVHLMTNGILTGVDFTIFSGPNLERQSSINNFNADGNAWKVVLNLPSEPASTTPIMFSRNILVDENLQLEDPPLDVDELPFGDSVGVVIYPMGRALVFRRDDLTQERFNPDHPVTGEPRAYPSVGP